jgi:hypothetical protein
MGETCAKCGKQIGFWTIAHCTKAFYERFPEYRSKKLCLKCAKELIKGQRQGMTGINELSARTGSSRKVDLDAEVNSAILWQENEFPVGQAACQEFFEARGTMFGAELGHKGFLVVTNQRVLFACKLGRMSKNCGLTYGINLEDIVSASLGKFGFNNKLIILDKTNQRKEFINPSLRLLIPIINSAITDRRNQLLAEKQKEHVQIILDFSSLKDVMSKGGLVMTTYKCPNCNGMVTIPEAGKVLMCQYCGSAIKPVDIFEKIKSLVQ